MREGDGVVGAAGTIGGRPVYCYAQDQTFVGGSLGEAHADTIVRVMQLAGRAGAPVIGFVASGGARMDDGIAALGGYGRIFRESVRLSGRVPQISIITGVSAGGGAYSPALTDFVVMTESSAMFLTGPGVVREVMGEDVDAAGARRPARARQERRLPVRGGGRRRRRRPGARAARPPAPAAPASARRTACPRRCPSLDPSTHRAGVAAQGLRRARRDPRARGRRRAARGVRALGAQHGHRVLPHRRPRRSA